jgi:DNA-binding response OmpR family regulator
MERPQESRRRHILIVEDDTALARLVQWHLEEAGFAISTAHTGKDALLRAAEHRPDLIILDLKLPDMHGYDVAKEFRKLYHPWAVPILMLTGMDKPIDQLRGFAFGADAYLTKPFRPTELLETILPMLGQLSAT